MTPERWQQVQDVLVRALDLAPGQRSAYLNQACASDPSLRREVETLLASSDHVRSSFLEAPAAHELLASGTRLGEYEIKSPLGAGGMGEVYRARDSRLGRDVAIKVLPAFVSSDGDRLRRFEQEAQAAAALSHPNILAVFQMGTHDGSPYLVSELLEGETLREHLRSGKIPVGKAIDYGAQIARGLAAAHERGIVHRDLKPENLFVTRDGRVKILDFGLAKLTQLPGDKNQAMLACATEPGMVMGTVGYMSPEQVRAQSTDHRADIFSFGAILYEMLAGKRAFEKPTSPETMSAILNEDPPGISQFGTNVPPALQRVVHRCLEKNPEQRFQSASDLAFALDALSEISGSTATPSSKEPLRISGLWPVAAMLVAVIAVVLVIRIRTPQHAEPKRDMVERQLTANPAENSISAWTISRDGKYLAYTDFMSKNLYLLAIDSGETRQVQLPATYYPADWFPDGNHLLLVGGAVGGYSGDLWKISMWDSSLRKLWGGDAYGAAVSPDGSQIAFMKGGGGAWLMGGDGEGPRAISPSDDFQNITWSPTGNRLAYIRSQGNFSKHQATIETCDLSGGKRTVVLSDPGLWGPDGFNGIAWLRDGRIIYSVYSKNSSDYDSDLWAITADPNTGKQSGTATRLASWKGFQAVDPRASADGKRLIASRQHRDSGVYIGNLPLGDKTLTSHRLTLDSWFDSVWSWTKDSKAVLFESNRNGRWAIFEQDVAAKAAQTLIAGSENYFYPVLSAQGRLLYSATASSVLYEPTDTTMRLMSTPMQGGPRSTLMMGSYYYACGSSPNSPCVMSELRDKQLTFFHLDPVKGKGDEIARIHGYGAIEPEWDLSSDGSNIAIVDPAGEKDKIRILNATNREIKILSVRDSKWPLIQQIRWAMDGKELFAVAESASSWDLLSINTNGNAKALYEIPMGTAWIASFVPSPDGRSIAFTKRVFVNDVMLLENF